MYKNFFKRLFDIIGALSAIPFVLLISLFVGLAIYIEDRGDIFYLASRRGRYGEIFKMFKFRSMKMNAPDIRNSDNSTYNSPDDPRITKVGRFIRKTSSMMRSERYGWRYVLELQVIRKLISEIPFLMRKNWRRMRSMLEM